MKGLLQKWKMGISYLCADDLISFYVFFTIIFAECAYVRSSCPEDVANMFTIILLGYVGNVLLCSWGKGVCEIKEGQLAMSICYVMLTVGLFVLGCIIDVKMNIALFAVPVVVTAVCVLLRYFYGSMSNKMLEDILQVATVIVPWMVFMVTITLIPEIPTAAQVLILAAHMICAPFMAYLEDNLACQNIFELACMDW